MSDIVDGMAIGFLIGAGFVLWGLLFWIGRTHLMRWVDRKWKPEHLTDDEKRLAFWCFHDSPPCRTWDEHEALEPVAKW